MKKNSIFVNDIYLVSLLTIMRKQQLTIERELRSKSANIIWPFLSTPAGLSKWVADSVETNGDSYIFTWGEVWKHHEIRTASLITFMKNDVIRFAWNDDTDENAYWELKIVRSDITGDYILIITDFAEEDDLDTIYDLWEKNLERLHHSTGL